MKKLISFLFVAMIAMFVISSCQKDNVDITPEKGEMVTINVNAGISTGGVNMGTKSASELGDITFTPDISGGFVIVLLDAATDELVGKDTIYPTSMDDTVAVSFVAPANTAYKLFGMDLWAYDILKNEGSSDALIFQVYAFVGSSWSSYNRDLGSLGGKELRHGMVDKQWLFTNKKNVLVDSVSALDVELNLSPMHLISLVLNLDQAENVNDVYFRYTYNNHSDSLLFENYEVLNLIQFTGSVTADDLRYIYFQTGGPLYLSRCDLVLETDSDRKEIALSGYGTTISSNQYVHFNVIDGGVIDRNVGVTLGNVSVVTNAGDFDIVIE